jgi:hypothetical protein
MLVLSVRQNLFDDRRVFSAEAVRQHHPMHSTFRCRHAIRPHRRARIIDAPRSQTVPSGEHDETNVLSRSSHSATTSEPSPVKYTGENQAVVSDLLRGTTPPPARRAPALPGAARLTSARHRSITCRSSFSDLAPGPPRTPTDSICIKSGGAGRHRVRSSPQVGRYRVGG